MTQQCKCQECGKIIYGLANIYEHMEFCSPNINFEDTPVQQEIKNNEVLSEVQAILERQTEKGLAKYPRTVHEEDYNLNEWIDHVREELIDTLVYLTVIKQKIKKVIG